YVAQAAGVGLLGWEVAPFLVWTYVALYGAAFGAISPLRASTMADQFGRRAYGSITPASGIPVAGARSVGPTPARALYGRAGTLGPALALAAGAFLLSALAVGLTPRARVTATAR